jgi:hypothetical protein
MKQEGVFQVLYDCLHLVFAMGHILWSAEYVEQRHCNR